MNISEGVEHRIRNFSLFFEDFDADIYVKVDDYVRNDNKYRDLEITCRLGNKMNSRVHKAIHKYLENLEAI